MLNIDSWIRFALTELYAVLLLAFVFRKPILEERKNVPLKILLVMLAMYLAHLYYVLLSPTYFFRRFSFSVQRLNLVPFRALNEWMTHPFSFFGMVVLFMPVGFFEVLLHPADSRGKQLLRTVGTALSVSLFVEIAQMFNYRVPDIDDVILNMVGALLGAFLCMLLQRVGFDRTRVGAVLLPRIPRSWHRHMYLNRFCVILVVSMEVIMFTVNYIVTIPKPKIRENEAEQQQTVALELPAATPAMEAAAQTAVPREQEAAAQTAVSPEKEPAVQAEVTDSEFPAAVQTETRIKAPAEKKRVYDTSNLQLEARNVLLVKLAQSGDNAEVIYAVNSRDPIYPASTLKMLTALTVLEIADPEEKVTLGMEIFIPPSDASRAGLEYGMTLTVRELLEGLLLPSGADAAYALGVYCGRKLAGNENLGFKEAVTSFVEAMNRKAKALGAVNTTAANVVGLDDKRQLTTAEDILRLAKAFLDHPVLAEICSLADDEITGEEGRVIYLSNTNKMLHRESPYYNAEIAGVKTGTTSRAGNCLVSVFTTGGEKYICIVMNSSYYGKFTDTQQLFEVCAY